MKKNNYLNKSFFIAVFIFYMCAFIVNLLITEFPNLEFGKDHGLVFRVISTIILSILFYLIARLKISLGNVLMGFALAFFSYLIVFLSYLFISFIIYGDNRGFNLPLIFDQLFASTVMIICTFITSKFIPTGARLK